jgi:hypothetical protein
MKIIKFIAGGLVVVATYNVGKLVGGFKVIKVIADVIEEVSPGTKKHAAKLTSEKVIDIIFDDPDKEEESQQ